ncbi:hypothetical protein [Campylobacter phage CJLB-10]|nr:hypothetical protein [Campylobacter phage CJLB-10]
MSELPLTLKVFTTVFSINNSILQSLEYKKGFVALVPNN